MHNNDHCFIYTTLFPEYNQSLTLTAEDTHIGDLWEILLSKYIQLLLKRLYMWNVYWLHDD